MKERGTIYSIGEIEDITTKSGRTMSKQQVVVEFVDNTYLRRVAMYAVTDGAIDAIARMEVGDQVDVVYSVSSREWKDRWYTDVTLLRIDDLRDAYTRMHPQQQQEQQPAPKAEAKKEAAQPEGMDDLPF